MLSSFLHIGGRIILNLCNLYAELNKIGLKILVSRVQVSFLASFKTPPCVGFLCLYPQLQFCPVGVEVENIQVNCGRVGVKSREFLSTYAPMSKASAGTVQVKNSNGRLQLVFPYKGSRKYLSLKMVGRLQKNPELKAKVKRVWLKVWVVKPYVTGYLSKATGQTITLTPLILPLAAS
jgi:hypothetical protein